MSEASDSVEDSAQESESRWLRFPSLRTCIFVALGILLLLWAAPTIAAFVSDIDIEGLDRPYLILFSFVTFDAVIPIFPSESLLTTASNLAAQEGSSLELWKIIVAGSAGAIVGDSALYWLSRTVLRNFMSDQVDKAQENEKVRRGLEVLNSTGPMLIVFGRFVPGLRFVTGATMGLTRYPYPRFLLWDAIGGTLWASYTCIFSYLVASAVDDKPVLSIAISVVVTTALLALLYMPLKKSWEATGEDDDAESDGSEDSAPEQTSATGAPDTA